MMNIVIILVNHSEERINSLKIERRSLQSRLNALERKIESLHKSYLSLSEESPESLRNKLASEIDDKDNEKISIQDRISEINEILVDADKIRISKDEFLNTLKKLAQQMRNGDARQKDILCRNLFLNTRIDNQKTPSFIWKEPFDQVVKLQEIISGTRERT